MHVLDGCAEAGNDGASSTVVTRISTFSILLLG